jgi:hypothetical protein
MSGQDDLQVLHSWITKFLKPKPPNENVPIVTGGGGRLGSNTMIDIQIGRQGHTEWLCALAVVRNGQPELLVKAFSGDFETEVGPAVSRWQGEEQSKP